MPAVDKLLLEEALQDSPQVPPAARVPLARGLEAEEALPAPGWQTASALSSHPVLDTRSQKEIELRC